jgi:coenzyme F420-reducing hydrogenase alpha subunit
VEIVYGCDEALRIISEMVFPDEPAAHFEVRATTGYACTEAPRGILYHRYRVDENGIIVDAKIVPPTSQNQKTIENDLGQFVQANLQMPQDELQWKCEQAVRNYDPCISCATHFLKLRIEEQ